jgi:hypothetical protein
VGVSFFTFVGAKVLGFQLIGSERSEFPKISASGVFDYFLSPLSLFLFTLFLCFCFCCQKEEERKERRRVTVGRRGKGNE